MSKLSENYIAVSEGRLSKAEFVRQARMLFPQHVTQFNTYNDSVKILRQRGLLSEDVIYQCKGDKFPLESIERGIDYELEQVGIHVPDEIPEDSEYKKAKKRAIDNLCKDPMYYLKKKACCCDKCEHTQEEAEKKKGKDYKQKDTEGQMKKVNLKEDLSALNIPRRFRSALECLHKGDRSGFKTYFNGVDFTFELSNPNGGSYVIQLESPVKHTPYTGSLNDCVTVAMNLMRKVAEDNFNSLKKSVQEGQSLRVAQQEEDSKTAEKLFMHFLSNRKVKDYVGGWKEKRSPQQILDSVRRKFPKYKPGKDLVRSFNLCWIDGKLIDAPTAGNAAYRGSHGVVHESKNMKEEKLLRESITRTIQKVLAEAATQNLAALSDQNASVQNVPAILNNLENVVTEIESFIIKEQTKIQSIFDSIGDIKNEDNIPIGHKFAQPILDAFKRDLEPVLQKIDLENLKMPEAPEVDDAGLESNLEGLEAEPKQTMFTPRGEKPQPLAESKQPKKKYTA